MASTPSAAVHPTGIPMKLSHADAIAAAAIRPTPPITVPLDGNGAGVPAPSNSKGASLSVMSPTGAVVSNFGRLDSTIGRNTIIDHGTGAQSGIIQISANAPAKPNPKATTISLAEFLARFTDAERTLVAASVIDAVITGFANLPKMVALADGTLKTWMNLLVSSSIITSGRETAVLTP